MKTRGFSLIELLITVAVLGIVAAIAVPSYSAYVQKSRRADAMSALLGLQLKMEKFRGNCATYPDTLDAADDCAAGEIEYSATSTDGHYTIDIPAAAGNSYTLRAVPANGSVQASDTTCNDMRIVVGTGNPRISKTPAACWGN